MLNYIWISLIAIAILTAVGGDISDEVQNPYRNGVPLEGSFLVSKAAGDASQTWEGDLRMDASSFDAFYGIKTEKRDVRQPVSLAVSPQGQGTLVMDISDTSPAIWKKMAGSAATRNRLTAKVLAFDRSSDGTSAHLRFLFEPIRFVRVRAVTQATLEFAGLAVEISIGLIGIMALWLGLMKIAEEAGFIAILTKGLSPFMKKLFPEIPPDHPAVGAMIMNMAANMLGLNNAATPLGLKAMEELDKLNPRKGTATDAMITFLTINTGGLVLIPATAIAVRAAAGSSNPGIIIGTSIVGALCATTAGVTAAKLLQRLPLYKKHTEGGDD